ncbi:MAG: NADAR family protein [Saprospiraceae bacterium]|nr:NADAR family protein [Saprospiraceae bacterium]
MKYDINYCKNQKENKEFIFFWGHRPSKDGTITKTCFSQWWQSSFEVENKVFKTAEHWMMAQKALLFNDMEIFDQILKSNTPEEAKKLGRLVSNYNEDIWVQNRYEIVLMGNQYKFEQNPDLKTFLIETGDKILVEASPVDPVWGIGLASDHEDAINPSKWQGLNLLGFALMEVRDYLKRDMK